MTYSVNIAKFSHMGFFVEVMFKPLRREKYISKVYAYELSKNHSSNI